MAALFSLPIIKKPTGTGHRSMTEHVLSMCGILNLVQSMQKNRQLSFIPTSSLRKPCDIPHTFLSGIVVVCEKCYLQLCLNREEKSASCMLSSRDRALPGNFTRNNSIRMNQMSHYHTCNKGACQSGAMPEGCE